MSHMMSDVHGHAWPRFCRLAAEHAASDLNPSVCFGVPSRVGVTSN